MLGQNVLGTDVLSEGSLPAISIHLKTDPLSLLSICELLTNYLSMLRSYLSSTVSLRGSVEEFHVELTEIVVVILY